MLNYLFTTHEQSLVWSQLGKNTYRKMATQMSLVVEQCSGEQELLTKRVVFYNSYFVQMSAIRGNGSHAEFMTNESPELIAAMYSMYRLLFSIKEHLPFLPPFGQVPDNFIENLKK